jgi:hypothetical protein
VAHQGEGVLLALGEPEGREHRDRQDGEPGEQRPQRPIGLLGRHGQGDDEQWPKEQVSFATGPEDGKPWRHGQGAAKERRC